MDATLDAFLNEINEIAPLKPKENEWKECFDSRSGFSYYWNTKTDEVTWEEPPGFTPSKSSKSSYGMKSTPFPTVPPELVNNVKDTVKIYKIATNCNTPIITTKPNKIKPQKQAAPILPRKFRKKSDSDDEKVILISSYGSESDSESEKEEKNNSSKKPTKPNDSDDEENDILSTVKKRAEQLKMLGQNEDIIPPKKTIETPSNSTMSSTKAPISGFSLVAGYDSNSDEENESNEVKVHETTPRQITHSTLFPIMETPDVNDFIDKPETKEEISEKPLPENTFDSKSFQRKRRLGINFVPTQRNVYPPPSDNLVQERRGLGFSSNDTNSDASTSNTTAPTKVYSNFKSAGMEFVKPESKEEETDEPVDIETLKKSYEILHEKLSFLCEGNKDLMPVQIILIQIETLYGALKAEGLKPSYLHDWLDGTNEDLLKLEKEAAPDGWLLQWDRLQKRYYYHNPSTGQGQWEYPQPDVVRQEEAMDISTTPPPSEIEEQTLVEVQPPLPPSPPRESPSPPPPPIISEQEIMPDPPSAPKISGTEVSVEPLPPGVDLTESTNVPVKPTPQTNSDINSAFDTFYSELAAIENTSSTPSPSSIAEQTPKTDIIQDPSTEEIPKKKRKKVKMGQGLSLKKKDVSKLVEKWKNVQKNY